MPAAFDISFLAGTGVTLLQFLLLYYTAMRWAYRLFPAASMSLRLCAAAVAMFWIPGALFAVFIPFGLFQTTTTTVALAILAAATWFIHRRKSPHLTEIHSQITTATRHLWRDTPLLTRILAGATAGVFLIRFARGLVAPPLAWDALTYHLLKAGRWVQTGGWVFDNSPDAWQFYEYFPPLGDVYWAWTMLATRSDAWLAVAAAFIWLASGLGTFAAARVMGANQHRSFLATLIALSVPASLSLLTAAYVDTTAMAVVMLGTALLLAGALQRSASLAAVAAVSLALAVAIKITFLPYLLVAMVITAWISILNPARGIIPLLLTIPAVALTLAWQIYLVTLGHTPFFPAPLSLAGLQIEPGQPEFLKYVYPDKRPFPYLWEMPKSFYSFLTELDLYPGNHHNLTWAFPALLIIACVAFWRYLQKLGLPWRTKSPFTTAMPFLAILGIFTAGAVIFIQFWLPSTAFYRGIWLTNMGRFFLPWYGLLAACVAISTLRRVHLLLYAFLTINLFYAYPRQWTTLDYTAVAWGILITLIIVAAILIFLLTKKHPIAWILAALAIALAALTTAHTRASHRYKFYENTDIVYDVIRLGTRFTGHAAHRLDDPATSHTIHFTSDYVGIVYRWFRYPLMGSRLQNRIVYISPTVDGSPWSHSIDKDKPLSKELWLQRLDQAGVDAIVSVRPFATELQWIEGMPAFKVESIGPKDAWVLIRK